MEGGRSGSSLEVSMGMCVTGLEFCQDSNGSGAISVSICDRAACQSIGAVCGRPDDSV